MKLNDTLKKLVAALRSGEYSQTTGALETEQGNCCLGVLCRLYAADHPEELKIVQEEGCPSSFGGEMSYPPVNVWRAAGLRSMMGMIDWSRVAPSDPLYRLGGSHLAAINDSGVSFEEIADFIERNPAAVQA